MIEFYIDNNDPTQAGRRYSDLDAFTQGYIEAAFFTSTGTGDDEESGLESASFGEINDESLDRVIADCARWQYENADTLQEAYETETGYDAQRAGNDYWYTRNGHGTGFWDRDLGEIGDMLSKVAGRHTVNLVRGDDGLIYFE